MGTDAHEPVSAAEFASALQPLGAPARLVVAVSGGPDSMALARLAAGYVADAGEKAIAVTIDHGLRAQARQEAEQAGAWCRAASLDHRILDWRGLKPATGVQEAARAARYGLLAEFAGAEGADAILTGHTADDQAETVFMRLARGSGPRGLSGMPSRSFIAAGAGSPVALLRPLLAFSRARIEASLVRFGQASLGDPSNDDPAYERVRIRGLLAGIEEQGILTRAALLRTAARQARAARRIDAEDAAQFARAGRFDAAGRALIDDPGAIGATLAARLIRAVNGADFGPNEEDAALALSAALATGAAALGGAILRRTAGGLIVCREPAALLGRAGVRAMAPLAVAPGARILWDRRFIIENAGPATIEIAPLGRDSAAGETLAGSPAIRAGGELRPAADFPHCRVTSLAPERFAAEVIRFP